jgi:hypothetical protein
MISDLKKSANRILSTAVSTVNGVYSNPTSRKRKTINHEGHEGTQRKTLKTIKLFLCDTLFPSWLNSLLFACPGGVGQGGKGFWRDED